MSEILKYTPPWERTFPGASPETIAILGGTIDVRCYAHGELISDGGPGGLVRTTVLVVHGGAVRVFHGRSTVDVIYNDRFLYLGGGSAWPFALQAHPEANVSVIEGHVFDGLCARDPSLLGSVLSATADHRQRLYRRLQSMAVGGMEDRVLDVLREDAEELFGGVLRAKPMTQLAIAARIGACRETVSRVTTRLQRSGILERRGKFWLIHASRQEVRPQTAA